MVGEIGAELGIPNSTLSHHLDKLKNEELVSVRRESTFLRYSANTEALQELSAFLYAECCTRNKSSNPKKSPAADRRPHERRYERNRPREICRSRPARRRGRAPAAAARRGDEARCAHPITAQSLRPPRDRRAAGRRRCSPRSAAAIRPRWPN